MIPPSGTFTRKLCTTLFRSLPPTRKTPRNFQTSRAHSSRNFRSLNPHPTTIHTLIRPIFVISVTRQSTTVARGRRRSSIAGVSTMANGGGNGDGEGSVTFQLTPSSLLKIQKGDITQWSVDRSSDAISSGLDPSSVWKEASLDEKQVAQELSSS